ncbi:MAG TPA: putative Ig domain-containing protein, partial [Micromonosporaceae bacterium]
PQVLTMLAAAATFVAVALSMSAPAQATTATAATSSVTTHAVTPNLPPTSHMTTRHSCATPNTIRTMQCFALIRTDVKAVSASAIAPNATPSGYGPANLASAYKLSTTGGAGATVAIVDAMNDPTAAADLATYRSQFGLPACTVASGCLRIVNQNGATSPLPANDAGWAGEESLDLDMVSAICPNCHIILVEANSASDANLYAAEDRAVTMGAKFVSNSWGGGEYSGQTTDDSHFNHPGVAITVSSGDNGNGAEYPATSRYVTAVGGTHLVTATNSRGWTETAWNGAGSGCSAFDAKPTWQTVSTNCTRRAEADVSAVADPATGVAVYQTFGASGWVVYGGTSVAAPVIAGVYALAGTPAAGTYPASYPYSHTANLFDVTSGSNGTCGAPICTAGTGWDGPTGLGTPNGTAAFTNGGGGPGPLTMNNPGNQTGTVGTAVSLTLSASGGTAPYTFSATGLPAGLSISSSGVISGTPTTAGTSTVTATVHDSASGTASTTFTWTINPTGTGCSGQLLGNPGFETGSAAPWTSTAGVINPNGAGETSHSGTYYAWLDGYGTTHTDTLSQTVTIPAGCHATLQFWLHIDTSETTTTTQFDKLTVTSATGGVTTTLATFSNLNHATGYQLHSVTLPATTGSTVIKFSGTEDVSLQTSFVVDDTALNLS